MGVLGLLLLPCLLKSAGGSSWGVKRERKYTSSGRLKHTQGVETAGKATGRRMFWNVLLHFLTWLCGKMENVRLLKKDWASFLCEDVWNQACVDSFHVLKSWNQTPAAPHCALFSLGESCWHWSPGHFFFSFFFLLTQDFKTQLCMSCISFTCCFVCNLTRVTREDLSQSHYRPSFVFGDNCDTEHSDDVSLRWSSRAFG